MKKVLTGVLLALSLILLCGIVFLSINVFQRFRVQSGAVQTTGGADYLKEREVTPTPAEVLQLSDTSSGEVSGAETFSENAAVVLSTAEAPESAAEAVSESASAAETAEAGETASDALYATTTVNVRSEASAESEKLGQLTAGEEVRKTGESGDWTQIDYNGQTAYVKSEFLSAEKNSLRTDWDLDALSTESVNFGYSSANRDERNVPTDWEYYENRWGEFAVKWIGDTSKNTIYLTMDEGFGNSNTITILDTLKEKGVKITFFITKNFADDRPDLVQRMIDEGHQLGNHSCTHPDMTSLSREDQTSQIMTLQNQIKDSYGYDMKYFRFPQGIYSAETLGLVNNLGLESVFWSYAYNDYDENNQPPVIESLNKALDALHPGAIYLLHASSDTNTSFLADFIDGARERGFEFGELSFLG